MLIKIKAIDEHLHFESDGDALTAFVENFEGLYISNKLMTFHIDDVDVIIQFFSNGCLYCLFDRKFSSPWHPRHGTPCDEVHIEITPERINVSGYNELGCVIQTTCVNG